MKKRLKPKIKKALVVVSSVVSVVLITMLLAIPKGDNSDMLTYVNDYIFDHYYPVISTEERLAKPYNDDNVSISKYYYELADSEEKQQNSIIYYNDVYMQNSGVEYSSDELFDVLSSLSGTVTNVSEDELLGKSVEIKSSDNILITYQSLGEVSVKKGDNVVQGQIIGKSGKNKVDDKNSNLHFEIYRNGELLNPEKIYNKSLKEITKEE